MGDEKKVLNVEQKLMLVQSRLHAPKGQYNKFGKYSYRSCEDILEAVKPLLAEVGATLVLNDEIVFFGDRYYIKATATLTDADEPSDYVSVHAFAREDDSKAGMAGAQLTGSTSSYARKYALNGLLLCDDCKDPDSNEQKAETDARTARKKTYSCESCGEEITERKQGGKTYSAETIVANSLKRFGTYLCWDCMANMKG